MLWFKHRTGSHDDPDILDACDEYGDFGYSFFFILLEIYGQEYRHNTDGWIDLSQAFLRRKLHKSWRKVELLLNFYEKKRRISYKINGKRVMVKINGFNDIASNKTRRLKSKLNKQGTDPGTDQGRPIEVDIYKEDIYNPPTPLENLSVSDDRIKPQFNMLLPMSEEYQNLQKQANKIIDHLNQTCEKAFGRNYKPAISLIMEPLYSGKHFYEQYISVIDFKSTVKFFRDNPEFLCPETLFGDKHFDEYIGQATEYEARMNAATEQAKAEQETAETAKADHEQYFAYLDAKIEQQARFHDDQDIMALKDSLHENSVRTFIDPLRVVEWDGSLVLYHENASWVQDHYGAKIAAAINQNRVKPVAVEFTSKTEAVKS